MSILIKGMEMPKDIEPGLVIEFADGIDGKRYARLYHYQHGGLTEWLEAISIPPHGRLIDADELVHSYYHAPSFPNLCKAINDAPTVIPAEEGQ